MSDYTELQAASEATGGYAMVVSKPARWPVEVVINIVVYVEDPCVEPQGGSDHVDFLPTELLDWLTGLKYTKVSIVSVYLLGQLIGGA